MNALFRNFQEYKAPGLEITFEKGQKPEFSLEKLPFSTSALPQEFSGHTQGTIHQNTLLIFFLETGKTLFGSGTKVCLKCWGQDLTNPQRSFVRELGTDFAAPHIEDFNIVTYQDEILLFLITDKVQLFLLSDLHDNLKYKRIQFPEHLNYIITGFSLNNYQESIYIIGGFLNYPPPAKTFLNCLKKLQIEKREDMLIANIEDLTGDREMKAERTHTSSVVYDNKLYIYEVVGKKSFPVCEFWQFDLDIRKWERIKEYPAVVSPKLNLIDDQICLFGSIPNQTIDTRDCFFSYQIKEREWNKIGFLSSTSILFVGDDQKLLLIEKSGVYSLKPHQKKSTESQSVSINDKKSQKSTSKQSFVKVPTQNSTFNSDFNELLFKEKKYTDINFKIGENIIPAHKYLLAARCKFFDKMFSSGMKESTDSVIEITDMSLEAFNGLLEYIYCDGVSLSEDLALEVIQIADKYSIVPLKVSCEEFLITCLTRNNVVNIGILAHDLGTENLEKKAIEFMVKNLDATFQENDIKKLPSSMIYKLIKQK